MRDLMHNFVCFNNKKFERTLKNAHAITKSLFLFVPKNDLFVVVALAVNIPQKWRANKKVPFGTSPLILHLKRSHPTSTDLTCPDEIGICSLVREGIAQKRVYWLLHFQYKDLLDSGINNKFVVIRSRSYLATSAEKNAFKNWTQSYNVKLCYTLSLESFSY